MTPTGSEEYFEVVTDLAKGLIAAGFDADFEGEDLGIVEDAIHSTPFSSDRQLNYRFSLTILGASNNLDSMDIGSMDLDTSAEIPGIVCQLALQAMIGDVYDAVYDVTRDRRE